MTVTPECALDHEVAIIGGGFSGIGAAILLEKAGFGDYLMIEDGDGVGGAWHWNTYPGVAVDIPSFSYQFSFEQMAGWSRVYAPGRELKAYAEHCVDKYDVRRRTRLNTRIVSAAFDEEGDFWRLGTADGDTITARHVVGATGVLTQPKLPEIAGIETYAGTVMHTARWDHDVDLAGKRVAVIGTGASAVQTIPSIAHEVEHLTVFQRTPIWCLPKLDSALPLPVRLAMRVPGTKRVSRLVSQTFVELTFPLAAHFHDVLPVAGVGERVGLNHLRRAVKDPEVREKLTPRYALGCKRPSFSNAYLQAFNRENVFLETAPIDEITPTGIRTADGTEHEVDVLVLATGFKVFEKGNMPAFSVTGVGGVDLEKWWEEHRFQAYQGVSVPGFPNFFAILGPYGYNGSSYFNLIETQMTHIVRCLRRARRTGATRVEVTPEANARYFEQVLGRRRHQVFFQPSCQTANSYYFDANGDVPFRPSPTLETMWTSSRFDLDDYRFEGAAAAS
ncbi:NAD(P)/FAD-dependent oxidoreductase [Nocardioides immobilis]|uniref:NAD(P)/FAD-dependent oxidoreductase n=1 Tax=Nocardioides immobilis TaxID=2049295 RepID=A0A417XW93_9ACTN|nr:NAD(P)/FAD-dependent oxidoreductase [Nocardioides immobilis]RHW24643.1 NAD(P)/FAD-dependent oxidoreductase [Nocardioides immobilis]